MATTESRQLPARQRVVIIGAGIVGNSVAYHLSRLGETEITLLDKGPLPNPGGSTGHASNFIFPVDHSKEMTALTKESMRQYKELDVYLDRPAILGSLADDAAAICGVHSVQSVSPAPTHEGHHHGEAVAPIEIPNSSGSNGPSAFIAGTITAGRMCTACRSGAISSSIETSRSCSIARAPPELP